MRIHWHVAITGMFIAGCGSQGTPITADASSSTTEPTESGVTYLYPPLGCPVTAAALCAQHGNTVCGEVYDEWCTKTWLSCGACGPFQTCYSRPELAGFAPCPAGQSDCCACTPPSSVCERNVMCGDVSNACDGNGYSCGVCPREQACSVGAAACPVNPYGQPWDSCCVDVKDAGTDAVGPIVPWDASGEAGVHDASADAFDEGSDGTVDGD